MRWTKDRQIRVKSWTRKIQTWRVKNARWNNFTLISNQISISTNFRFENLNRNSIEVTGLKWMI